MERPDQGFLSFFNVLPSLRAPNSFSTPNCALSVVISRASFRRESPAAFRPALSPLPFPKHTSGYPSTARVTAATDRANRKPSSSPRPSRQASSRVILKGHPLSRCLDLPAQQAIPTSLLPESDVGHLVASNRGQSSATYHLPIDAITIPHAATATIVPSRGRCHLTRAARVEYRAVWSHRAPAISSFQPHSLPGIISTGHGIIPAGRC